MTRGARGREKREMKNACSDASLVSAGLWDDECPPSEPRLILMGSNRCMVMVMGSCAVLSAVPHPTSIKSNRPSASSTVKREKEGANLRISTSLAGQDTGPGHTPESVQARAKRQSRETLPVPHGITCIQFCMRLWLLRTCTTTAMIKTGSCGQVWPSGSL